MPFRVYREDLGKTRLEAMGLLQSTRTQPMPPGRYDWLYRDNPDGLAVMWSIRDEGTGEMAGFAVALPRRMLVDSRPLTAWNCADFSMRPRFRTLGLALKLRRAAKEGVDGGSADFLYSHPNERMEIVHSRVGHRRVGHMLRLAKVLRTNRYVRRRVRPALLAEALAQLADPLLQMCSREQRHRPLYETRVVAGIRFDERFDDLFEEAQRVRRVVGVRDARYLNWRHSLNPFGETHAVLAERAGRLRGYALFQLDDGIAHIKDLFAAADEEIMRDLLAELIRHARALRLEGLSTVMLEGNPSLPVLEEFGFVQRLKLPPVYSYCAAASPWSASLGVSGNWFLTAGDRDV